MEPISAAVDKPSPPLEALLPPEALLVQIVSDEQTIFHLELSVEVGSVDVCVGPGVTVGFGTGTEPVCWTVMLYSVSFLCRRTYNPSRLADKATPLSTTNA
jgi:hypothetical protein